MAKVLRFLKNYWWVFLTSLLTGFFAMMPVLIAVGTSQKLEKHKKCAWIWGIGFACSCLFFLLWVPEIF